MKKNKVFHDKITRFLPCRHNDHRKYVVPQAYYEVVQAEVMRIHLQQSKQYFRSNVVDSVSSDRPHHRSDKIIQY